MSELDAFKEHLKFSEGNIPHMYLDTVGKVTVGVGNMMPTAADAKKLKFVNRVTGKEATAEEIQADFDAVSKRTKGLLAHNYKSDTKLDLPSIEVDKLLDARIEDFKRKLADKFPDFSTYPQAVQFALLDMAFNVGVNGLVTKFPKFTQAIKDKKWAEAAKQSNRPQVASSRNAAVKGWLNGAAEAAKPKPLSPTTPQSPTLLKPAGTLGLQPLP